MKNLKPAKAGTLFFIAMAQLGCGGGGGGGDSTTPATDSIAEGLWIGTTSDNRKATGLIFEDGLFYVIYSVANTPNVVAGVVQGNSTINGSNFRSTNAKDFNLEGHGTLDADVSATAVAKQSLSGAISNNTGVTKSFSATYSNFYETAPSLSAVAGTFSGQVASSSGIEFADVTVAANGRITGQGESGCSVSGKATPRARGNAYLIELTFGGSPCLFANQTLSGIGYYDAAAKILYSGTPNSSRTDGVLFVGAKN